MKTCEFELQQAIDLISSHIESLKAKSRSVPNLAHLQQDVLMCKEALHSGQQNKMFSALSCVKDTVQKIRGV